MSNKKDLKELKRIDLLEMKNLAEQNHDIITGWKPVMRRMDDIFKPDGKFDRMVERVIENDNRTKAHESHIKFLWAIVTSVVLTLIVFIAKELGR